MDDQLDLGTTATSAIVSEIKAVLETARGNVAKQVNSELLNAYWNFGRIIAEYEQSSPDRADYGKQTLKELSRELTAEFGKGFSRANLQNMRAFYLTYEKCQTLSGKLSHITVSFCRFPMLTNAAFTKKRLPIPTGPSVS